MSIGVALGKVAVGALGEQRLRSHFFGGAVAEAEALAHACRPGEILVQRAIARSAAAVFRFGPPPPPPTATPMWNATEQDQAQAALLAAATLCGRSWAALPADADIRVDDGGVSRRSGGKGRVSSSMDRCAAEHGGSGGGGRLAPSGPLCAEARVRAGRGEPVDGERLGPGRGGRGRSKPEG